MKVVERIFRKRLFFWNKFQHLVVITVLGIWKPCSKLAGKPLCYSYYHHYSKWFSLQREGFSLHLIFFRIFWVNQNKRWEISDSFLFVFLCPVFFLKMNTRNVFENAYCIQKNPSFCSRATASTIKVVTKVLRYWENFL